MNQKTEHEKQRTKESPAPIRKPGSPVRIPAGEERMGEARQQEKKKETENGYTLKCKDFFPGFLFFIHAKICRVAKWSCEVPRLRSKMLFSSIVNLV